MLSRYVFPIILIIIGVVGVIRPEANFGFFSKLAEIAPKSIQFAPMYQMVFGLIGVIGLIGVVEVFITNRARKQWQSNVSGKKATKTLQNINYRSGQNLPRGRSKR